MEWKRILSLFLIPVVIIIYGLWQCWRASSGGDIADDLRMGLAVLALFLTGIDILIVGYGVAICTSSARAARASQALLVKKFDTCRRLLPFLMFGEILFCGLAAVCLIFSEMIWASAHVVMNAGGIKFMLIMVLAIGAILWMLIKSLLSTRKCFALFKPQDSLVSGICLRESDSPELWQWVRQLSQKGQLTSPDNIVAGFLDCFYVTANAVQIEDGERLTGNTLYLPLTYMALLEESEIAAVVGHELGHFTGEDTQYSLRFMPLYSGMQNSIEQMANNAQDSWIDRLVLVPALNMASWFLITFHETVSYWSRIREHAADEAGARVASSRAFSTALLKISALDGHIDRTFENIFYHQQENQDVIASLSGVLQKVQPLDILTGIDNEISHPTDSHPTTRSRIAALNVELSDELLKQASTIVLPQENTFFNQYFGKLARSFGESFVQKSKPKFASSRNALEEDAALATESVDLWAKKSVSYNLFVMSLAMVAIGLGLCLYTDASFFCWLILAIGLALLPLCKVYFKRMKLPYFTLTSEHITSCYLPDPLPLERITNCEVQLVSNHMSIKLWLTDGDTYGLPTKRFMRVFRYQPSKNIVLILLPAPYRYLEGDKVELEPLAMWNLLGQYIESARARAMLQQIEHER
ncbi:M48 family metallopeptidase [Kluyvera sichuanensis]